jgi:hypothetical protein
VRSSSANQMPEHMMQKRKKKNRNKNWIKLKQALFFKDNNQSVIFFSWHCLPSLKKVKRLLWTYFVNNFRASQLLHLFYAEWIWFWACCMFPFSYGCALLFQIHLRWNQTQFLSMTTASLLYT